jgi:hypothetical protein
MGNQISVDWTKHRVAEAGVIITLLISVILISALAPTIVSQSSQAENDVIAYPNVNQGGASLFALMPLLWAVVGIAVVAAAVIGLVKF